MKVYLPAIKGHVPTDVVRTFRAFLEFCFLVRRNIITEDSLNEIQDALTRFHHYRKIFDTLGIVDTFSLPRQHSMTHYVDQIRLFGAPNGLCSSITESKHIKAVKEPWRWSSKNQALGQMLLANQRLDKLAASRVDFAERGMLVGTALSSVLTALCKCSLSTFVLPHTQRQHLAPEVENQPDAPVIGQRTEDEVDNGEIVDGPTILANVQLAKTVRKW